MFDFEKCIGDLEDLCRDYDKMTFSQGLELEKKLAAHFGQITELYYKISDIEKNTVDDVIAYVETDGKDLYWDTFRKLVRCDTSVIVISENLASAVTRMFDDIDALWEEFGFHWKE